MNLQIENRHAIVCGASKGLGRACAVALAEEGVNLTLVARGREALEQAAQEIHAATGVKIQAVAADVTTEQGRAKVISACPAPDMLINNTAGPKPGDFREWTHDDWMTALNNNMFTPIELIRLTVDGMMARRFGRIVNITSAAVKAPIDILGLSNGARSGLTGFVAGLARKTAAHNVTINNLLPGPFATDRLVATLQADADIQGKTLVDIEQEWTARCPAGRFGDPMELGRACAFLCSAHAGYITGQNWLLDGGAYPGTF